jgi:DHA1 family tetracycline resistance protein-like MFS transporter
MSNGKSTNFLLFLIFFTVFLNLLGVTIIIPVLGPLMLDSAESGLLPQSFSFQEEAFILGLLKASYPLMQFMGSPVLGALSDRTGRKPILSYALLGSVVGYVIFAIGILQGNIWMLFGGRIIDGLTGGNIAVVYSAIADISNEQSKTKNFGLVGMAFGLGFIIGPFIGGVTSNPDVVSWFSYATPFWLAALLTTANLLLVQFFFPETLETRKNSQISVFSGFYKFAQAFQMKQFRTLFSVIFLVFLGFTFFTQFLDVFLIRKFDFEQIHIGRMFGYMGIWIALTQGVITRYVSNYVKPQRVLSVSLLGVSVFVLMMIVPTQWTSLLFVLPFVSIFQGLNQPNLLTILSNQADSDIQGEVLGINQSLQSLGFTIPPIIAGGIISFNINLPLIVAGACMALSWFIFLIGRPTNT